MCSQISIKILEVLKVSPTISLFLLGNLFLFLVLFFLPAVGEFPQKSAELWLSVST